MSHEQLLISFEHQRNQIFTELHETQSSVVSAFKRADKRAERLEGALRAARNRLAKSLVETRAASKKKKGRVDSGLANTAARRSRRQAGTERDPGQAWQRRAEGGSDDPARATLGVVDSYVRYQALFLGGGDYADVEGDAEKKAEDGVAKNILQSLAKSARRSGTAKVVTSETIRQRNEARAEARALAAATAAAASSSADAAAVEPEDEEPEVDLDPDRVVEALFNNGRPLTIRERAEKSRAEAARKAVLAAMPAPLIALRRAIVVSQCVAKWKALVKRRRLARDLEMRRSYLTSLENKRAQEASDRAKVVAQSAVSQYMQRTGAEGNKLFGLKTPTHGPSPPPQLAEGAAHGGDAAGEGDGATLDRAAPEKTRQHELQERQLLQQSTARTVPRPLSAFPQLQLRPPTTPRVPRTDLLLSLTAPDPAAVREWERRRDTEDEMERYRRDRAFSRQRGGGIFTSAGEVSERWERGRAGNKFTESTIRLRVMRETDEIIRSSGRPSSSPQYALSGGKGSVWDHVELGKRAKSARGPNRRAQSRSGYNATMMERPLTSRAALPPRPPTTPRRPGTAHGSGVRPASPSLEHFRARPATSKSARTPSAPRERQRERDSEPLRFSRSTTPRGRTPQGLVRTLSGHA